MDYDANERKAEYDAYKAQIYEDARKEARELADEYGEDFSSMLQESLISLGYYDYIYEDEWLRVNLQIQEEKDKSGRKR